MFKTIYLCSSSNNVEKINLLQSFNTKNEQNLNYSALDDQNHKIIIKKY